MSKRQMDETCAAAATEPLKKRIVFEPLQLGPITNLDELDKKTLQFQNQKLGLRLSQRAKVEESLRQRVDQLEKRQTQDDAVINVINRYWNQLNEDMRILLQRFDAETGDEGEKHNEEESTTSFLTQLATWHKEELNEKLSSRVQVSQRAVAKIIQVFDHLIQRHERLSLALNRSTKPDEGGSGDDGEGCGTDESPSYKGENGSKKKRFKLNERVKEWNLKLQSENKALHRLNTSLHEKNHFFSLRHADHEERINAERTKTEELQNRVDDLEYELNKLRMRNEKLESSLSETQDKLKLYVDKEGGKVDQKMTVYSSAERKTIEQLHYDAEEQRDLAAKRLEELERKSAAFKETLKEVERFKMDLSTLPEHIVVETTEHKCLQSQFSVLYNEAMQLKTQLEDTRSQLQNCKNVHMRQIEHMESEELLDQKKLRTEAIQLEDQLAQVRKEYEMLRIEYEQNLAANEQTGPINKEMRTLLTSLQAQNVQLKAEVGRYKRKFKESSIEIESYKRDLENMRSAEMKTLMANKKAAVSAENTATDARGGTTGVVKMEEIVSSDYNKPALTVDIGGSIKSELSSVSEESSSGAVPGYVESDAVESSPLKTEWTSPIALYPSVKGSELSSLSGVTSTNQIQQLTRQVEESHKAHARDADAIKELKESLKKSQNDVKDMKLLLDMYKTCTKEQRDKTSLMASERKARNELEELRAQLKSITETKKEEKRRLADEDATRRIRQLEDQISTLQKNVINHKQEEEALLSEMEVTGQAFEDMQDQNSRLVEQLHEKEDSNIRLMSERIKSNQIQRLAREEREILTQQVNTLSTQVEAQNQVVRKLEEKERLLQSSLSTMDKELSLRQQAMEMHKRKAIESAQSAADLKLHLEKYLAQNNDFQQTVAEKTAAWESEAFKNKRLSEELVLARRKAERLRKIEMASDLDEILREEVREYKETLTCPSCKVKRKDAVLTKCFHCFCYDCLRTRYETRQRKCPKCNAAFGASDYHRLFLA